MLSFKICFRVLEESPQWLFVQGQDKQAKQLLKLNGLASYDESKASLYARKVHKTGSIEKFVSGTDDVSILIKFLGTIINLQF